MAPNAEVISPLKWIGLMSGFAREFIEIGHPDALYLQRLIRLAEAIEGAGWNLDEPPTEEFSEIMPQSN